MVNYPDRIATRSAVNHAVKLLEATFEHDRSVFEPLKQKAGQARGVLDGGVPDEYSAWPLLYVSTQLGDAVQSWTELHNVTCPAMILTLFRTLERWAQSGVANNFALANSVTRSIPDAPVIDATVSERELIRQREHYLQTIVESLSSSGSKFSAVVPIKPVYHYYWTVKRVFSGWTYERISDELVNGKQFDASTVRSAVGGVATAIGFDAQERGVSKYC